MLLSKEFSTPVRVWLVHFPPTARSPASGIAPEVSRGDEDSFSRSPIEDFGVRGISGMLTDRDSWWRETDARFRARSAR